MRVLGVFGFRRLLFREEGAFTFTWTICFTLCLWFIYIYVEIIIRCRVAWVSFFYMLFVIDFIKRA